MQNEKTAECGHLTGHGFNIEGMDGTRMSWCSPDCAIQALRSTKETLIDEEAREIMEDTISGVTVAAIRIGGSPEEIARTARAILIEVARMGADRIESFARERADEIAAQRSSS